MLRGPCPRSMPTSTCYSPMPPAAGSGGRWTTAFAIALTYRVCTNYLPPVWGFFSVHWLNRKAYL